MTNKFNSPGTPQRLPVVPLRDMVVGPNTMTTVFMSRPVSVSAAQAALKETDAKVVLLTQRQKEVDEPKAEDLWDVGVVGEITQLLRLPDGSVKGLVRGLTRCSLKSLVLPGSEDPDKDYYEAVVEDIPTLDAPENELAPFRVSLVSGVRHFLSGDRKVPAEVFEAIEKESDPVLCCDLAAAVLPLSTEERIAFIREIDPFKRFDMLLELMQRHAAILRPKFEAVLSTLDREIAPLEIASWSHPKGGYFVSFDAMPGTAKRTLALCKEAGVTMTGAGATFPYGIDPHDANLRLAPTYPSDTELEQACRILAEAIKYVVSGKLLEK